MSRETELHGRPSAVLDPWIIRYTKLSDALLAAVRAIKDASARRVVATKKTTDLEELHEDVGISWSELSKHFCKELFSKYDADRDEVLSTSEAICTQCFSSMLTR